MPKDRVLDLEVQAATLSLQVNAERNKQHTLLVNVCHDMNLPPSVRGRIHGYFKDQQNRRGSKWDKMSSVLDCLPAHLSKEVIWAQYKRFT